MTIRKLHADDVVEDDPLGDWFDAMEAQFTGDVDDDDSDQASEKPIILDLDDDVAVMTWTASPSAPRARHRDRR